MCSCGVSSALLWSYHMIACSRDPGSRLWYASPSRMSSSSSPMTGRVRAKTPTLVHAEATNLSPRTSRILVGSEMHLLFLFKSTNLLCVSVVGSWRDTVSSGWAPAEVILKRGEGERQRGDLTDRGAGGSERGWWEGSSLISRMTWSGMFGLAWSDGKVKVLNFSNSTKKLSRTEDGVGANGFAGGHQSVRDSHSWAVPCRSPFSVLGRALDTGRQVCSLEANLLMSRN